MEYERRKRGRPKGFDGDADTKTVQSLDKALRLLKALSMDQSLSLTDLVEETGISAPTAYRALLTMQSHDLVHHDDERQVWSVGIGAFKVGSAFLRKTNILEQARPVMRTLMETTRETANLGVIEGQEIVFISQVETHEPIRAFHRPGSKGTVYASGIGKALFAHMDEASARSLLEDTKLTQFTEKTITDVDALLEECKTIRRQGYSFDDEERMLGMRCIAAPIFNAYQEPIAAVSVSGPTVRVDNEMVEIIARHVVEGASEITKLMGGDPPAH